MTYDKRDLFHLVARAERGSLLPAEGRILRDAIELLDEYAMMIDSVAGTASGLVNKGRFEPSTTQSFRVSELQDYADSMSQTFDDDAPGRP